MEDKNKKSHKVIDQSSLWCFSIHKRSKKESFSSDTYWRSASKDTLLLRDVYMITFENLKSLQLKRIVRPVGPFVRTSIQYRFRHRAILCDSSLNDFRDISKKNLFPQKHVRSALYNKRAWIRGKIARYYTRTHPQKEGGGHYGGELTKRRIASPTHGLLWWRFPIRRFSVLQYSSSHLFFPP